MNLAIIPARGGSKRIVQKNLRPFCGRAVIEYSINAAKQSQLFSKVVVSTDCPEIAAKAEACGAETLERPAQLADDHTPLMPVIQHAIRTLVSDSNRDLRITEFVCCILATAPFVTAGDLIASYHKLTSQSAADFVVPVTSFAYPIERGLKIVDDRLELIWPEHELTRSQDLPQAFHDAGQFYWGTKEAWLARNRIFSANSIPFILPRHRVQDLDTLEDWKRAEKMFLLDRQQEFT